MQVVHKSSYFLIYFDKENSLFHYVFNSTTESMYPKDYINELKVFIKLVKEYRPKKVLGDMVDFFFTITPEIQEWITENLFTVYDEIGFEKIAILMSNEFIANLSIEQTMDEGNKSSFQTAYFDDEQEAKNWLLSTQEIEVKKTS